jgi:hypothetical protein
MVLKRLELSLIRRRENGKRGGGREEVNCRLFERGEEGERVEG